MSDDQRLRGTISVLELILRIRNHCIDFYKCSLRLSFKVIFKVFTVSDHHQSPYNFSLVLEVGGIGGRKAKCTLGRASLHPPPHQSVTLGCSQTTRPCSKDKDHLNPLSYFLTFEDRVIRNRKRENMVLGFPYYGQFKI